MLNLNDIGKRVDEIGMRTMELAEEAPLLSRTFDQAVRSGDRATAMICQIVMASRLMEAKELQEEVTELRKKLSLI